MQNNSKRVFENIFSRTKIYLVIIFILFVVLCIYDAKLIIPSIVIFAVICTYSYWIIEKRRDEVSKQLQDLTLSVDSAAKSTLINSPFPLVILETNGNIIWKSVKFNDEFANIDIKSYLNNLTQEIKAEIKKSTGKSIEKQIQIDKKTYEVIGKYVKTKHRDRKRETEYMMILYFVDKTEQIQLIKKCNDLNACIGIVMIDNYEEIMQRVSTENKPQIIAEIEKRIYEWASSTGGVMLKSERDTFIYVFEQKYLSDIEEEKFNILDTIKDVKIEGKLQLTLSIAISNEGETYYDKYKSALAAIDIALGRGGDQAVIRKDNKYVFFGGRTEELEKRTKVKARIVAHALEELIKESKDVMIMGHTNSDIDSIGSGLGIYRLAKTLGKEAYIVNNSSGSAIQNFIDTLKENEEYQKVLLNKNEAIAKTTSETLLVIVDTHKKNYVDVPELLDKNCRIVIIDHHRKSPDYIDSATLAFQEVYASSASELVTELLQYTEENIELTQLEIEGLYAGIMMDTKNFTFKTGVRTFEAAAYLRKCGVDIIKVKKWFQTDLSSYNIIAEIVKNAEIVNDTIAISTYDKEDKDAGLICAKSADELLTISDITASFVIGNVGDKIYISGRSIGDINVQIILEKLRRRRTYYSCRSTSRGNDYRRNKTRINNSYK